MLFSVPSLLALHFYGKFFTPSDIRSQAYHLFRSVSWWDEELHQLVKDRTACFAQGLDNDSNWSDYLKIRKELKQKIREKGKICKEQ